MTTHQQHGTGATKQERRRLEYLLLRTDPERYAAFLQKAKEHKRRKRLASGILPRGTKPPPTHCTQGHALSGDNLRLRPNRPRARECCQCAREKHWFRLHPMASVYSPQRAPSHCKYGHPLVAGNLKKRRAKGNYCLTCHRDQGRARYWRRIEESRAEGRKYAREHKIESVLRGRRWYYNNHEHAKTYSREHARVRNQPAFEPETRPFIEILLRDPCSYCGKATTGIDHIIPLAKSGPNEWFNYTGACRRCNSAKNKGTI